MHRNKSKNDAELKPNKSFVTAHLVRFYLIGHGATRFTQNPKEKKEVTSLWAVESSSRDLNSELPPAWSASSYLAPARVAVRRHERGFRRYLSADKGEGEIVDARERGMGDAPSR